MSEQTSETPPEVQAVNPGMELPEVSFRVTPALVASYRRATGNQADRHSSDSGEEVPPLLASLAINRATSGLESPPGSIHAKQSFSFLGPLVVGDELRVSGVVGKVYEKRGRWYVMVDFEMYRPNGDLVVQARTTTAWATESSRGHTR